MPIYVYEEINPDGSPGPTFEVLQGLSEAALTTNPETGRPVRRIMAPVSVVSKFGLGSSVSNDALKSKGFTKYVKNADGGYSKLFGAGPELPRKRG